MTWDLPPVTLPAMPVLRIDLPEVRDGEDATTYAVRCREEMRVTDETPGYVRHVVGSVVRELIGRWEQAWTTRETEPTAPIASASAPAQIVMSEGAIQLTVNVPERSVTVNVEEPELTIDRDRNGLVVGTSKKKPKA